MPVPSHGSAPNPLQKTVPEQRPPGFRITMFLSGCFLLCAAAVCFTPQTFGVQQDIPTWVTATFLIMAFCACMIALAGNASRHPVGAPSRQQQLVAAARRYAADEISLDEFGTITRELLAGMTGEWQQHADGGRKLEACKVYKEEHEVSLLEAKRAVEEYLGR